MDLELIMQENDKMVIQENTTIVKKAISNIKKLPLKKIITLLQKSFRTMVKFSKDNGIENDVLNILNKLMNTQYNKIQDILRVKITESVNKSSWWDEAKGSMFGAASFYPLLQAFIELDKVVKDTGQASMGYVGVYGLIWAAVISGKVILNKTKNGKSGKNNTNINDAYASM